MGPLECLLRWARSTWRGSVRGLAGYKQLQESEEGQGRAWTRAQAARDGAMVVGLLSRTPTSKPSVSPARPSEHSRTQPLP